MPMSNFPTGFLAGLTVRGMPLLQTQPGNVFWVDNSYNPTGSPQSPGYNQTRAVGGSDKNQGTYQRPFATIAQALSVCQQGNGDIIFLKPGHVEHITGAGTTAAVTDQTGNITVSGGTTIAFNVSGVAIIGLGSGPLRPTLIFDTAAAANIPVQAANMSIQNVLHQINFAAVVSAYTAASASVTASISGSLMTVTVVGSGTLYPGSVLLSSGTGFIKGTMILSQVSGTTGGVGVYTVSQRQTVVSGTITTGTIDFNIENCEFRDLSSTLNLITVYTDSGTANASDGFRFRGNRVSSLGTTAATTAIVLSANCDRLIITDNFGCSAVLNDTAAILAAGTAQLTNFELSRNIWERPNTSSTGGSFVSGSGNAWTGMASDNYLYQVDNSAGIWIATGHGSAFGYQNNYSPITGAVDKSGLINPAAV